MNDCFTYYKHPESNTYYRVDDCDNAWLYTNKGWIHIYYEGSEEDLAEAKEISFEDVILELI